MGSGSVVVLWRRGECGACDRAEEVLRSLSAALGFDWEAREIDGDASLEAVYGSRVPVVTLGGRELAWERIDAGALARAIRAGRAGGG